MGAVEIMQADALEIKPDHQEVRETPEEPLARKPVPARVKVLNPLSSTGPSMHAELLGVLHQSLWVRVPRQVLAGSTVQVRTSGGVTFGEVRTSLVNGAEFEIEVTVQRTSGL